MLADVRHVVGGAHDAGDRLEPDAAPRGIATLPGGIPIFKDGKVVGGIGVFFPGTTGFADAENSALSAGYDPSKPLDAFKGTNLDPKSVVAPVAGFPTTGQDPNLLQRLYTKIGTVTGFITPSTPTPRPTYTPGLSRRNKERTMERTWRRD